MAQWNIARRTGTCAGCERTFEDGERHVSTLDVGVEGLLREDRCDACWRARTGDGDEGAEGVPEPLFWWFTRHTAEAKKTVRLDLGSLEQLFARLEGREEEAVRELRYVICLILMRKRRVKLEKVERDAEGEAFVVRRPRREDRYKVFVFDFTSERMAELREELQAIFDGAEAAGVRLEGTDEAGEEDGLDEDENDGDTSEDADDGASTGVAAKSPGPGEPA